MPVPVRCLIAVFVVFVSSVARADIMDITAAVDGDIRRVGVGNSVSPFSYTVQTGQDFVNTSFSGWPQRGFFEFDLSSAQAIADSITAVRLDLVLSGAGVTRTDDNFIQVNLRGYEGNGAIEIADFGVSSTFLGSQTLFEQASGGPSPNTTISFDLELDLVKQLASSGSFLGIRSSQQFNFSGLTVRSLEDVNSSNHPTLVLTYSSIPEPNACSVLIVGTGIASISRRRRFIHSRKALN